MLSPLFLAFLATTLLPTTLATPTPNPELTARGSKSASDWRPTNVPVWKIIGAPDLECGDSCSYQCWQFTKTTLRVDGRSAFFLSAGFHADVKFGNDEVVANKDWKCVNCKDLVAPGKNNGWELTLKTEHSGIRGPLPIHIKFPYETALFNGVNGGGPFNGDQVISDDGFDCDSYNCGGEYIPTHGYKQQAAMRFLRGWFC
jgi:hypothetical protein